MSAFPGQPGPSGLNSKNLPPEESVPETIDPVLIHPNYKHNEYLKKLINLILRLKLVHDAAIMSNNGSFIDDIKYFENKLQEHINKK